MITQAANYILIENKNLIFISTYLFKVSIGVLLGVYWNCVCWDVLCLLCMKIVQFFLQSVFTLCSRTEGLMQSIDKIKCRVFKSNLQTNLQICLSKLPSLQKFNLQTSPLQKKIQNFHKNGQGEAIEYCICMQYSTPSTFARTLNCCGLFAFCQKWCLFLQITF